MGVMMASSIGFTHDTTSVNRFSLLLLLLLCLFHCCTCSYWMNGSNSTFSIVVVVAVVVVKHGAVAKEGDWTNNICSMTEFKVC